MEPQDQSKLDLGENSVMRAISEKSENHEQAEEENTFPKVALGSDVWLLGMPASCSAH